MNYKELGKNIRKYRRAAELTQESLAEKCGCSTSYIGQLENARSKPSLETIVKIANELDVTVDQLLKRDYKNPEYVFLGEIAKRIEKYTTTQKIQVCESLSAYLDSLEKFSKEDKNT